MDFSRRQLLTSTSSTLLIALLLAPTCGAFRARTLLTSGGTQSRQSLPTFQRPSTSSSFSSTSTRLQVDVKSLAPAALTLPFLQPLAGISITSFTSFQEALLVNGLWFAVLSASNQKSLTKEGLYHATALGVGLWTFLGAPGWLVCVSYLVLGSLVTKVKMKEKESLGIAEKRGGARGPENVWGSAATAMLCALLTAVPALPSAWVPFLKTAYVASLATKLSDTFGSEIGKAYGKTTYLITTLKKVPRGTEGAVSLEGTVAGVGGSLLVVAVSAVLGLLPSGAAPALACVLAAFVATTAESYIGATFQDSVPWLTNELVNLINTLIGAAVAVLALGLLA